MNSYEPERINVEELDSVAEGFNKTNRNNFNLKIFLNEWFNSIGEKFKNLGDSIQNIGISIQSLTKEIEKKANKTDIPTMPSIPTSLPANGGNADTVGGKSADEFLEKKGGTINGTIERVFQNERILIYRDIASFSKTNYSTVGTLLITLPKSWTSTMFRVKISGYQYTVPNSIWEVDIGAYNYSGTASWASYGALVKGILPQKKIRLAHDGKKCCILIGDLNTNWIYPAITVDKFIASFGSIEGWGTGWGISIVTSEEGLNNIVNVSI